jgi:hypothetical protein
MEACGMDDLFGHVRAEIADDLSARALHGAGISNGISRYFDQIVYVFHLKNLPLRKLYQEKDISFNENRLIIG